MKLTIKQKLILYSLLGAISAIVLLNGVESTFWRGAAAGVFGFSAAGILVQGIKLIKKT